MCRAGEWGLELVGLQVLCMQLVLVSAGCATFLGVMRLRKITGVAVELDIASGRGLGGDGCDKSLPVSLSWVRDNWVKDRGGVAGG